MKHITDEIAKSIETDVAIALQTTLRTVTPSSLGRRLFEHGIPNPSSPDQILHLIEKFTDEDLRIETMLAVARRWGREANAAADFREHLRGFIGIDDEE